MVYPSLTRREWPRDLIFITTDVSVRFRRLAMVAAETLPSNRSRV